MKKIIFLLLSLPQLSNAQVKPACAAKEDFNYKTDICNPLSISFQSSATIYNSIKWTLDDGAVISGTVNPIHVFATHGSHTVNMVTDKGVCTDTVTKTISLDVIPADIIVTHDTTICAGASLQLLTKSSLGFCWPTTTFLNDPHAASPLSSPTQNITYTFTAEIPGANLIVNGDFSKGNTGFTSEYVFANPNITEGQYFVGSDPSAWNTSLSACAGHTTGNDNMLLVNGAPAPNVNVWKQTIAVTPNTNYAFSTWVQALWPPNPAQLLFSINGKQAGVLISASLPTCTWTQFYTTWNSGNNTAAVISIVNINTAVQGNDFALDDISFAPVIIETDTIAIKVEHPLVKTNNDTAICAGKAVQLSATGTVASFNWSPATGLSNAGIANPLANTMVTTQYIVTGTSANGCTAKDTVLIQVNPGPLITRTHDTTICHDKTVQLNASGGTVYNWQPAAGLSNAAIANPLASPAASITYYVTVSNNGNCTSTDSIKLTMKAPPVFSISPATQACSGTAAALSAAGGNSYAWQPPGGLSSTGTATTLASPAASTLYTVQIKETTCNDSASLSVQVNILPLPAVQARSSNDVTCNTPTSQLAASGASIYLWQPGTGLNDSAIARPLSSPAVTTLYTVKGTDANGCSNYDSIMVTATHAGDLLVNMPNAFSPNGDGTNDCFGVSRYAGLLQHLDLSVYDRFGVRLFHTTNALSCWDGYYKGKLQDAGGFVYILKASTFCGDIFKKGIVMLVR